MDNRVKTTMTILLAATLLLTGCDMNNDQIIAEHKKCAEAGMDAREFVNGLTFGTVSVTCTVRESK